MFYVNFTDHFLDPGRVFGTMDLCACDVCVYVYTVTDVIVFSSVALVSR